MKRTSLLLMVLLMGVGSGQGRAGEATVTIKPTVPDWQQKLYKQWKELPVPPITPYEGPFGGEVRAFVGKMKGFHKLLLQENLWVKSGSGSSPIL